MTFRVWCLYSYLVHGVNHLCHICCLLYTYDLYLYVWQVLSLFVLCLSLALVTGRPLPIDPFTAGVIATCKS
jgi:hypothetical protein